MTPGKFAAEHTDFLYETSNVQVENFAFVDQSLEAKGHLANLIRNPTQSPWESADKSQTRQGR